MLADDRGVAGELLASLASGAALGSVAFAGTDGSYDLTRGTTAWREAGGSVRLSGTAGFVLDADLADVLVVAARDEDGIVAAVAVDAHAPGVRVERAATVDADAAAVHGHVRRRQRSGRAHAVRARRARGRALFDRVLAIGVVAAACDAAGVAEQALERAADYAKERTQFGKPIGSFQAVKHHCADMAIAVEASRAATRAAADALDGDPAAWATTAAITSSYVGPACSHACALGLLVHGGVGFTWEHDSHLFLKRVKLDEVLFGTPAWHRRRLADAVFPALVAS